MFGYIPDPKEHRYTKWLHAFRAPLDIPRDLRPDACKVLDQNGGSCTGHGTATGICTTAKVAGHDLGWIPSPAGIYTLAVALDRGSPLNGPLLNQGAMPNQVERAISEFGIRPMVPQEASTDTTDAATLPEPKLDELETDAEHCYFGWYEIATADEARVAIAAGVPVGIGTYVDSKFMQWTPNRPPLGSMNFSDPDGGGHWTVLLGTTSRKTFWLRNSWGVLWGAQGDCEVTDDFVNQASQLLAFGYRRIGR